jgi:hypothetical protein
MHLQVWNKNGLLGGKATSFFEPTVFVAAEVREGTLPSSKQSMFSATYRIPKDGNNIVIS